jgi:uncharacterized protein (TIGR02594 family)
MHKAGFTGTNSALARSWLKWGRSLPGFKRGAIVVFLRGSNPNQGHVAFALNDLDDQIEVVGGNQSDAVTRTLYPKSKILGYRYPA